MREVLQALLIASVVMWVGCIVAVLWVRHRVRRSLRIDPTVRSAAPTVWLVAPTSGARLHRRLRVTATSARLAATCDDALAPLAADLVGEARALEPSVLAVARSRRSGSAVRRELSTQISELEAVARRLTSMSSADSSGTSRLRDRLEAIESAREELDEIDLRAGLLRHA